MQSDFCGPFNTSLAGVGVGNDNYTHAIYDLATLMVEDCYGDTVSASPRCRVYLNSRIPFNVSRGECLWNPSLCLAMETPTVIMDSGLMDMNNVFGLNLPSTDQVLFRKKTSCAILPLENHTSTVATKDFKPWPREPLPDEQLLIINYGNFSGNDTWNNMTFGVSETLNSIPANSFVIRCVPLMSVLVSAY